MSASSSAAAASQQHHSHNGAGSDGGNDATLGDCTQSTSAEIAQLLSGTGPYHNTKYSISSDTIKKQKEGASATTNAMAGDLEFLVIMNDGHPQHMIWLVSARNIFAQQLPKMPREYITRLVLDRRHRTLIALKDKKVVGGICYRPYFRQKFAEIAFCAVTSSEQVRGYGTRLMNHLKQAVKTDGILNFLTYADNYAIGYFSKQGFTKDVAMSRRRWYGYIKDYEGGTLMECTIHPPIDYLRQQEIFEKQKQQLLGYIEQVKQGQVSVPSLRVQEKTTTASSGESGKQKQSAASSSASTGASKKNAGKRESKYVNILHKSIREFVDAVKNLPESWCFLEPVDVLQVPDYYDVIKNPIDLSSIEKKVKRSGYSSISELKDDLRLMTDNCRTYNKPDTDFVTCANEVDAFVEKRCRKLIEKHGEWIMHGQPPTKE
eukprot:gb/GECG01002226.1/.p1 GENE.gb/GECG01002226.1/~~gb/GECG01002226.1/.p1  ORF type:complete len:433 (+),score=58.20 gb/GECG01002226.1/:1-1299(+)